MQDMERKAETMLVFHVTFVCKPELREEFLEMIMTEGIDTACREEEGNIAYDYYLPVHKENELLLIEKWRDAAALAAHARQEHMVRMDRLKAEYVTDMRLEMLRDAPGRE